MTDQFGTKLGLTGSRTVPGMAYGIDISEHQRGFGAFDGWDFAIFRARNENGRDDYQFWNFWRESAGRTLRGVYGWPLAGAGLGANFATGEALVRDFPGSEFGYWADVESSPRGHARPEEVEAYVRGIEAAGGRAGLYSNIGDLVRSPYLDTLPWWMADYGPNDGRMHDPNAQAPRPPADRPWAIHQFSSAGGLDVNYAPSLALWEGTVNPPTKTQEVIPAMYVYRGRTVFGVPLGGVAAGDRVLRPLDGDDVAFGLSQAILDWKSKPGRDAVPVVFLDPEELAALVLPPQVAAPAPVTPAPAPPEAPGTPPVGHLRAVVIAASRQRKWAGARKVLQETLGTTV